MKTLYTPRVLTTLQAAQLKADLFMVELFIEAFGEPKE